MSEELDLVPGLLKMPPGLGEHAAGGFGPMAALLRLLFARWDAVGLKWVVLRNADELPDYTRYDVDILVQPDHLRQMLSIVEDVTREKGWSIAGRIQKRFYTCLMLMRQSSDGSVAFLPLDFFTALEFRGFRYLPLREVLAARVRTDKGVWSIPTAWDAAITLLKEWLPHGRLKANSRDAVQSAAKRDGDHLAQLLSAAVGAERGAQLAQVALEGAWERLQEIRRPRGRSFGLDWCRAAWANVRHMYRPSLGMVICLAGADGSGKSTLAIGLAAKLYKRPFKGIYYVHGNMGVLPRFRDMRAWLVRKILGREPVVASEPEHLKGMMDPIPAWKSMMLATYYALDLCLGRMLLRRLRGQWMLVIMDRSFFDYYYQLGHRNCPSWYLDFLLWLIPKPDLLFCLADDPDAIHGRKPELTIDEIGREQDILSKLLDKRSYACVLDGRQGADSVIAKASEKVLAVICGRREA
ncbi:MAG: hypothetical protein ACNA71_09625 [Kiritimatiellia bacterium]